MRFSNNNSGKRLHAEKLKTDIVHEQMEHNVPEKARNIFNRKPYQIGGKLNEFSNGEKNRRSSKESGED